MLLFQFILSFSMITAAVGSSQETVLAAQNRNGGPQTIKVITYNVQFLPAIASSQNERGDPGYRANRIAQEVSRFDIVALQETFDKRYRDQIINEVREAWGGTLNMVVSPKPANRFTNGGCLLLTRLPVLDSHSIVFQHYSTPMKYGLRADGFAAKGVIHARVARAQDEPDSFVDVYVTHLEARADHLRPLQYDELARFVRETSDPNSPVLLLGDFNTRATLEYSDDPKSQYSVLMDKLCEARPIGAVVDVWSLLMGRARGGTTDQESPEVGNRIDYILLGNPNTPAAHLKPVSINVNTYQDPKVGALSDHNAVEAEFEWASK
jgi:endonuclease/exonuclease/phosphatase family metal-dependent hydrolase